MACASRGPIADLLTWTETVGSQSWCVGLGRLLERCGDYWSTNDSDARSRIAYLAALQLISNRPNTPAQILISAVAAADLRSNLASYALIRLSVPSADRWRSPPTRCIRLPAEAGRGLGGLGAHRIRSRGAAALLSAQRLTRLRKEIAEATAFVTAELPQLSDPVPDTIEDWRRAAAPCVAMGPYTRKPRLQNKDPCLPHTCSSVRRMNWWA